MKYLLGLAFVFLTIHAIGQSIGLHVAPVHSVLFGDTIAGSGKKLIWIPGKAAFRAGQADGVEWDLDSLGMGSFVGGGRRNQASGVHSFIGGGEFSKAVAIFSFVGGGSENTALGESAFVGGGGDNMAFADNSFVGGGFENVAMGAASFVGGGTSDTASGNWSFVGGGRRNNALGSYSFVGGGLNNGASGDWSFIGGGQLNKASGEYSFVGGGYSNEASEDDSFVGGGRFNMASGTNSFVGGGDGNGASGEGSFVGGGIDNHASQISAFIGGGDGNGASGERSFVGGGKGLRARSADEAVFGSFNLDYTPIDGSTDRLFVIGNGNGSMVRSNAVTVLKNGLVGIGTATPDQLLTLSAADEPVLRFDRSDPGRWDWEVYAKGGHLHFRGGADSTGTGLTDLVTFQSDSSIVVAGLKGTGERDLCVDADGRLVICDPSMSMMNQQETNKASAERHRTIDFMNVIKEQQIIINGQSQEIKAMHTRMDQLEKIIGELNESKYTKK